MRDDLLHYYERELAYLRKMGAEFAQRYPKVASRLELEATKCEDPHVERLLEGFAFLAARVHLKVDDEIPEISESLLQVVYPHYVQPIPSFSLVQFQADADQGGLTTGERIPRGTPLFSRPVGGVPCRFRTCYDTTLWPITVNEATWRAPHQLDPPVRVQDTQAVLRLELGCMQGVSLRELELDTLRLHIHGESGLAATLYELILNHVTTILVRNPDDPGSDPVILDARRSLSPVGFEDDETLLPPPRRSLGLYGLLLEYFTFPQKFLFFDLGGLDRLRTAGFDQRAEVLFCVRPFEQTHREEMLVDGVGAGTFRTGCTPIVNLFEKTSEPILLNQRRQEYPVVPDARRRESTAVFSVDEVKAVTPGSRQPIRLRPFYSLDHGRVNREETVFWQVKRRSGGWRSKAGSTVNLSFVDLGSELVHPDEDSVTARLTCYNRDLPSRLPFGDDVRGDFEIPGGGGAASKVVALVKPTPPIQPPLGKAQLWRLISQLSLNYTSLVDGGGEGLRELLRLHNFADSLSVDRQIHGIRSIHAEPCYSRIESAQGLAFARGHRVGIEFDEDEFAGGGVLLFAAVLERFLGRFVSLNSFSVLEARSQQRKQPIREWPPRSGSRALL